MKLPLYTLLILSVLVGTTVACQSQSILISFDRETLTFPITVKKAVERYKLSFNSPGYYYRKDATREISLNIAYQASDYYNEYQPKEVLYDREVVSYVFKYDGSKVKSDSVRMSVERLCHCKLMFIADSLSAKRDPGYQPSVASLMPQGGRHYYGIANLNQDVVVGFRNKPNFKGEMIPEVRFFYKQSPDLIRRGMTQY